MVRESYVAHESDPCPLRNETASGTLYCRAVGPQLFVRMTFLRTWCDHDLFRSCPAFAWHAGRSRTSDLAVGSPASGRWKEIA